MNKQYSEAEYGDLVQKIKQHMKDVPYIDKVGRVFSYGEFFPPEFLPYGYNETLAYELFPLTKEEALGKGYAWRDQAEKSFPSLTQPQEVPDTITQTSAGITSQVIACEHAGKCAHNCTTAFKILPQEFAYYQQWNIPVPTQCHNCRHYRRITWRYPVNLRDATCQCTGTTAHSGTYQNQTEHEHGAQHCSHQFQTSIPTELPNPVYCRECFNAETV